MSYIAFIVSVTALVISLKVNSRLRKQNARIKRINDVMNFRLLVIELGMCYYNQLPDFEEMLVDGKDLLIESYVEDFTLCMN